MKLGPGRLPLEHHQLMPQRQNFQGEMVPRSAERQRVDHNDPENGQHDLLTLIANPRQSIISSPDGISATHSTTWSPRGQTPIVMTTGQRFGLNMLSAVSAIGLLRFMVVKGRVSGEQVCEFMRRLMYRAKRPVFLILDGHPMHKSRLVKQCEHSYGGKLKLFFLPPYSPELNPDEQV